MIRRSKSKADCKKHRMTNEVKPWITITVAGATAGVMVSALAYSATYHAGSAAATTTGFVMDAAGEVLGLGAKALFGDVAGVTVKVMSKGAAKTSEETLRTGSYVSAAVVSAVAGAATALTTIALTVYALTTKTDMTFYGGALYILSVAMTMIIVTFSLFSPASLYNPIWCALAVIFYGFFLIYDTQLIAGRGHYKLSVDDYIIGALIIYLDIIMLFLELLKLFGRK